MTKKLPRLWEITYTTPDGQEDQRYQVDCVDGYWVLWDCLRDCQAHIPGRGGRDTFWSEDTAQRYLEKTTVAAWERACVQEVERKLNHAIGG